tara:strand:+ start:117 stop:896 length:780 start_codon:yes stop_codon:yes gene_type:complete
MVWFIRRWQKGVKNSGTSDILVSDSEITVGEFVDIAHQTGPGKYMLGIRGKGIRGFRKITDCLVEEPSVSSSWITSEPQKVFAAEEISVRKNIKLSDLSDGDIMDLMGSMSETEIKNAEDFSKFKKDLGNLHSEISRRGLGGSNDAPPVVRKEASQPLASAGFAVGKSGVAMGFVGGLLVGVVGTMYYYKSQLDKVNTQLDQINKQLNEAESAIKRAESREAKRVENEERRQSKAVNPKNMNWDNWFLQQFNNGNGPSY